MDLGNAPESYSTSYEMKRNETIDGARHLVDYKTFLGKTVFSDKIAKLVGGFLPKHLDDNDGVIFVTPIERGKTAVVKVEASKSGFLNAWMDFNIDGSFEEQQDQIFKDVLLSPGVNELSFEVPVDAKSGDTYSRFRFSTAAGLSFKGCAPDGEVEDYKVNIN